MSDQEDASFGCESARPTVVLARTQAPVTVRASIAGLHMSETHLHLMQRRVAVNAQDVCETVPNRPLTIVVANRSNAPSLLPEKMLVAQCTPASDTFWP